VAALLAALAERFGDVQAADAHLPGALRVAPRRQMVTVPLEGAFARPEVYAHPTVLGLMAVALEQDFVLESFGLVVSFPGAPEQHMHRDGPFLFAGALSSLLPAHAVTVAIPLVDMTAERGTTRLYPGSHRPTHWKDTSVSVDPDVAAGGCIAWDYRTLHGGTENRSDRCRPLLYLTYSKPWWRDVENFAPEWNQGRPSPARARLILGSELWSGLPADRRFLFRHVERP
jgi:ectoine hydroxylase-related dioxygenase (phytanoyl-CoA dioxygenase family)